jgi:large subunit ribosomal protein L9
VPKGNVRMPTGPIKHTGEQTLQVSLHTDVMVEVHVQVVGDVD